MTLLEQWQSRALDAERRIKRALEIIGNDEIDEAVLVLEGQTPPEQPEEDVSGLARAEEDDAPDAITDAEYDALQKDGQ